MYLIGTDEAGYGPNFGPLVVSTTVWEIDETDADRSNDLYERLAEAVSRAPDNNRISIADSKLLYKSGKRLCNLERGVLAALGSLGEWPKSWQAVWKSLDLDCAAQRQSLPWYHDYECRVPLDTTDKQIESDVARLTSAMDRFGVRLLAVRSRAIFPEQFNQLIEQHGTKGAVLSDISLSLVRSVWDKKCGELQPTVIVWDKHGGRNRYEQLLKSHFLETPVEIIAEGRAESVYHSGPSDRRIEFCFRSGAEEFLPTALASMACKYLRELAMRAFNRFWISQLPQLHPTAGYPLDAKRFKKEIATLQRELGIHDSQIWRNR